MSQVTIYRCHQQCPIHKNCFVLKTETPIKEPVVVLYKCVKEKKDIRIIIGGQDRPP